MVSGRPWHSLVIAGFLSFALLACDGGDSNSNDGSVSCQVEALEAADGSVEITFWHAQQAENEVVLENLVTQFESEEPRVDVTLVNQVAYSELLDKYLVALGGAGGDVPAVAQMEDISMQRLIDSQSTVPIQACVDAEGYELADFSRRALDFYSTEGVLRAMPWNVSTVALLYNRNMFEQAGLDPDRPPQTLDEVREYSQQIVDSGVAPHGTALHIEPYAIEYLYAKSGVEFVNNGNGREGRATETRIDSDEGVEIASWWKEMVESGLAVSTGSQSDNYDHLLALGNQEAAMTFEASGAIGPAEAVLASGEFTGVEMGVGALPALDPDGGVPVGDGSLWLPEGASDEETAAGWALIKFLSEPEQQAALSIGSQGGYVPIRQSAVDAPELQTLWAQKPWLRVPFDELTSGPRDTATAGSVLGDYQGVRDALRDAYTRMLVEGTPPEEALARAQEEANEVIRNYNERIGA